MYKHALTVVSKAAYKTLKRGASSFLGTPPKVSASLHMRNEEAACIEEASTWPGQHGQFMRGWIQAVQCDRGLLTSAQVEFRDASCIRVPPLPPASQEALSRTSSGCSSGNSGKS